MRLPVYPEDLAHNRGLKCLAKRLRRQWCGPSPISLELAQEVLSKGFGYRDFHDLRRESISWPSDAPVPGIAVIRSELLSAAKAAMKSEEWLASDQAELKRVVDALPIPILSAFKPRLGKQPNTHLAVLGAPDSENNGHIQTYLSASAPLLTEDQLLRLIEKVSELGSPRDNTLLACLLSGLRASDASNVKVSDFSIDKEGISFIHYRGTKRALPYFLRDTVSEYIQVLNLSHGDFLFSSKNNPKSPASSNTLRRACRSWADKADIEVSLVTPSVIRSSMGSIYPKEILGLDGAARCTSHSNLKTGSSPEK